ncbi:hypothetical protein [Phormidium tenue]|uniref:Uncharacterized protein n=1 Tax=Phormidium tenue FACHB-1050 TaxID=2692857 RepID=A0ABR8CIE7_9CYAN|nr:hypothetical protein [Phormidium tenue]MBD2319457.1 hypothetical protein [Phormidium tenue FACHB-1050]
MANLRINEILEQKGLSLDKLLEALTAIQSQGSQPIPLTEELTPHVRAIAKALGTSIIELTVPESEVESYKSRVADIAKQKLDEQEGLTSEQLSDISLLTGWQTQPLTLGVKLSNDRDRDDSSSIICALFGC